jgi:uncharacterized Zn finger protein
MKCPKCGSEDVTNTFLKFWCKNCQSSFSFKPKRKKLSEAEIETKAVQCALSQLRRALNKCPICGFWRPDPALDPDGYRVHREQHELLEV